MSSQIKPKHSSVFILLLFAILPHLKPKVKQNQVFYGNLSLNFCKVNDFRRDLGKKNTKTLVILENLLYNRN